MLLVGRVGSCDVAAFGRLIRRSVKAAERVRQVKRDFDAHPVSGLQWRFGFRQIAPQAEPSAVRSLRREKHALVGVVHLGIPQSGCRNLLRFAIQRTNGRDPQIPERGKAGQRQSGSRQHGQPIQQTIVAAQEYGRKHQQKCNRRDNAKLHRQLQTDRRVQRGSHRRHQINQRAFSHMGSLPCLFYYYSKDWNAPQGHSIRAYSGGTGSA